MEGTLGGGSWDGELHETLETLETLFRAGHRSPRSVTGAPLPDTSAMGPGACSALSQRGTGREAAFVLGSQRRTGEMETLCLAEAGPLRGVALLCPRLESERQSLTWASRARGGTEARAETATEAETNIAGRHSTACELTRRGSDRPRVPASPGMGTRRRGRGAPAYR